MQKEVLPAENNSLVLQNDQYYPVIVAPTQLHKGLKGKIKIVVILVDLSYTVSMGIFMVASFPGSCVQVIW